jgi:hypothetical protein
MVWTSMQGYPGVTMHFRLAAGEPVQIAIQTGHGAICPYPPQTTSDAGSGTFSLQEYHNHQLRGIPYPMPRESTWFDELKNELLGIPNGRYESQVDSLSQFLNWYIYHPQYRAVELSVL